MANRENVQQADGVAVESWPVPQCASVRSEFRGRVSFCAMSAAVGVGLVLVILGVSMSSKTEAEPLNDSDPSILQADTVELKGGEVLRGKLLDISKKRLVLLEGLEEKTISRREVEEFTRGVADSLHRMKKKFRKVEDGDNDVDRWLLLARFCAKRESERGENWTPERRRALRRVLRLDPSHAKAKQGMREVVFHSGSWLTRDELSGFELSKGALVEREGGKRPRESSKTRVVKEKGLPSNYQTLERTELAKSKRIRLEKDIAKRRRTATKVREAQDREYEGVEWENRHKIRTPHFEIQCNSTRRVARLYGDLMELIRAELSKMFNSKIRRNLRSAVKIYKSQEEFIDQDTYGRWGGRGLGGYYIPPTGTVVAFHGTFGFTGTTFSVLAHEGTHYFQGLVLKSFDNVPVWLVEGLAVYFGDGSEFDPETGKIKVGLIPRDRLLHIQSKIRAKRHTPIKRLVGMKRWGGGEPFRGTHYADAWAVIYYLVKSGRQGQGLLREYWTAGIQRELKRRDFTKLANKYFGSIAELETQYLAYIMELDLPSAGEVKGEYYISDTFRFLVKLPSPEWQYFKDSNDQKMVVGMISEKSGAEVRLYFKSNFYGYEAREYVELMKKSYRGLHGGVRTAETTMGGLPAYRLRYTQGGARVKRSKSEKERRRRSVGKDVVEYVLVQIDGVAMIRCFAKLGESRERKDAFETVRESFTLDNTRRW